MEYEDFVWQPFGLSWVYRATNDPAATPIWPPDPASLSWEPFLVGEAEVDERPKELPLLDDKGPAVTEGVTNAWRMLQQVAP